VAISVTTPISTVNWPALVQGLQQLGSILGEILTPTLVTLIGILITNIDAPDSTSSGDGGSVDPASPQQAHRNQQELDSLLREAAEIRKKMKDILDEGVPVPQPVWDQLTRVLTRIQELGVLN
jgi:hypothetical protein